MYFHIFISLFLLFQTKPKVELKPKELKILKYSGVSPPNPVLPKEIPPPGGKCMLYWPGFQMLPSPGGSRFFFLFSTQISISSEFIKSKNEDILRLSIANCQAWDKHAWRDLITQFFKTPVNKASFYQDKKKNSLVIDLVFKRKMKLEPTISHIPFQNYYLLLLEFQNIPDSTGEVR